MAFILTALHAFAEGSAVDAVNGKLSIQAGRSGGSDTSVVDGALTFPVAHSLGAQIDVAGGRLLDRNSTAVGGHLFWRDPESALFGVTASHDSLGNANLQRVGFEGESYISNITLKARIGSQHEEGDSPLGHYSGNATYSKLRASWYVNEDLVFSAKMQHASTTYSGLDVEWQPSPNSMPGFSVFALMSREQGGGSHAGLLGMRYYFDSNKTLIKRHRTGDPESLFELEKRFGPFCPGGYALAATIGSCIAPMW